MSKAISLITAAMILPIISSCVHQMEVLNSDDYAVSPTIGPRQNVAVVEFEGPAEDRGFHGLVVEGLRRHPSVGQIQTSLAMRPGFTNFSPDVLVKIKPHATYAGSGWNYLITFPGFLIFTHAWHGYNYTATIETEVEFYRPGESEPFEASTVETDFEIRHCDFNRGFWASSGWWIPGWGASSLLAGTFMLGYDDDASEPFRKELQQGYGNYVAEKIMSAVLNRLGEPALD